ncbi:MAG: DNA recombination protein RmuC [Nitrospirota bacterium]|nr:DNA recombination protein RmuC [Nitrospirota bacterium]
MEAALFVIAALLAVTLGMVWLVWKRAAGADAGVVEARIDRLEATLKENLSGSGEALVARIGEKFEGKHRDLSESLSKNLEERTRRIEETVRELKEQNQQQLLKQERELRELTDKKLSEVGEAVARLKTDTEKTLGAQGLKLSEALAEGTRKTSHTLQETMKLATDTIQGRFSDLQKMTDGKLSEISGKVAERLDEGFKNTQKVFTDVVQRLTIIDQAQQKIADLSKEMVSLQDILSDKKSRGVFGEVQLNQLVANALPESAYALQYELSPGFRVDCAMFLPEPTGTVAVDSKFPLENFRRMFDKETTEPERVIAARSFKSDVKKHIDAIADKYIVPGVTSDGAVMFLPAEAIFAEIHAHHPDLVDWANRRRVWITSPTTMMAILTTARAVLKDEKTREQVHIIQEHLRGLGVDFARFQKRMDKLATHIDQAHRDVEDVGKSARKITSRFEKIEKVQIEAPQGGPVKALAANADAEDEDEAEGPTQTGF